MEPIKKKKKKINKKEKEFKRLTLNQNKKKSIKTKLLENENKSQNNGEDNNPKKNNLLNIKINKNKKKKLRQIETKITKEKTILIQFNPMKIGYENTDKNIMDNINDLPYNIAKNKDKRNIAKIFISIIIQKLDIIRLFFGNEKMKSIFFSHFLLSLLINFFFNALLYSDEIVSHKYHNNGKLEFIVSLVLSLLSNIFSSIIGYYFDYSELIEERLEQVLEMNKSPYYKRVMDNFLKRLKSKIFLFIIKEILILLLCFYYIIIFCIIYSFSRLSLLYNYFYSLLEDIIKSILITCLVSILRKTSLSLLNRYIYNTSKYLNENL